ncbi:MAG: prepilin-type N-terminal cleavage/methylation domain-containing protein [Desulfobacteraceae bacterium]|jgi:prepilin-type N-terminal cleavage/methylation domain-containing protein
MKPFVYFASSAPIDGEQGFTLIEAMIALLVFTIGIMAVSAMAITGFNSFNKSRTETAEVNRTIKNVDALKSTLYSNTQIFNSSASGGASNYPVGTDQADFNSWDFNDVVVRDVKLIAVENNNNQFRGPTASSQYRLYVIKADKPRVQ